MVNMHIPATLRTPGVDFNAEKAFLLIQGNSIPENSDLFFQPLHDWVKSFLESHKGPVTLRLFMIYFNTATIRHIIGLMTELISHCGDQLRIEWAYETGDEEIRDRGQDLADVVRFRFVFDEVGETPQSGG